MVSEIYEPLLFIGAFIITSSVKTRGGVGVAIYVWIPRAACSEELFQFILPLCPLNAVLICPPLEGVRGGKSAVN
jgi:hypothetical protein